MNAKLLTFSCLVPLVAGHFDFTDVDAAYAQEKKDFTTRYLTDQENVSQELCEFLIENSKINAMAMPDLVRNLWDRRVESGMYKGKSPDERETARARLAEVLVEYIRDSPDNFAIVKKLGVVIYEVPGDVVKENGVPKLDDGVMIQRSRWSIDDWFKHRESADKSAAKAAAKSSGSVAITPVVAVESEAATIPLDAAAE